MRRNKALRSLSSDHHTGLVIARRARKAATGDSHARTVAGEALTELFSTDLEAHFRREEDHLLPLLRGAGGADLVERTLQEHKSMRALIAENDPKYLAVFADMLTAHIRFEEKQLFEAAQRLLGPGELTVLGQDLENEQPTSCSTRES